MGGIKKTCLKDVSKNFGLCQLMGSCLLVEISIALIMGVEKLDTNRKPSVH